MALKSTVYKVELHLADMDHQAYQQHNLTLARHPSETTERLMVRLLAFVLLAHQAPDAACALIFGKGLSSEDEPDLWQKDLTGAIQLWVEVGLPSEKAIRQACGRSRQVVVLPYGGRVADMWWQQNSKALLKSANLTVINLPDTQDIGAIIERNTQLSCSIEDEVLQLSHAGGIREIAPQFLKRP